MNDPHSITIGFIAGVSLSSIVFSIYVGRRLKAQTIRHGHELVALRRRAHLRGFENAVRMSGKEQA